MTKTRVTHEEGYVCVVADELDASPSPTATIDAGVWLDPKYEKEKVMEVVAFSKFTTTIFKPEELKDVKYIRHQGCLIVTHPNHPAYKVNMRTYEWEEVEPLL